jgi:hypothetical protein
LQPLDTAQRSALSLRDAFVGHSVRQLIQSEGLGVVIAATAKEIGRIDAVCGAKNTQESLMVMAEFLVERCIDKSFNAIRLLLRDGINAGKVHYLLTYPMISEWVEAHEAQVEEFSYNAHMAAK